MEVKIIPEKFNPHFEFVEYQGERFLAREIERDDRCFIIADERINELLFPNKHEDGSTIFDYPNSEARHCDEQIYAVTSLTELVTMSDLELYQIFE